MIRELNEIESCMHFINRFAADPDYSDPMLSTQEEFEVNLLRSVEKPNDHILGVYNAEDLTGLFVFLILEEEKYIEMIVGLSDNERAYNEIADYLQAKYPGFKADFVFNPRNVLLRELLVSKNAEFDIEQLKMVHSHMPEDIDLSGVEPLSERYADQYSAMHGTDCYWTADKVMAAKERFSVYLAVEDSTVVGYIDFTNCFEENEPYDLFVAEDHRRRGWGRKLITAALKVNYPKSMMLLTETDNDKAIALYESVGFVKAEGQNSQTATWLI